MPQPVDEVAVSSMEVTPPTPSPPPPQNNNDSADLLVIDIGFGIFVLKIYHFL